MKNSDELNQLSGFTEVPLQDCRKKSMYRSKPHQEFMFKGCALQISWKHLTSLEEITAELDAHRIKKLPRMKDSKEIGDTNFF